MSSSKTCRLNVDGLTCGSCEQAVRAAIAPLPGVEAVEVDATNGQVDVRGSASSTEIAQTLQQLGYEVRAEAIQMHSTWKDRLLPLLWIPVFAVLLTWFNKTGLASIDPSRLQESGLFVVGFGAIASLSTCSAAVMGLLMAWQSRMSRAQTLVEAVGDQSIFQVGRLLGFALFGGLIGALGKQLSFTVQTSGFVLVALALLMLWIGLDAIGWLPKRASSLQARISSFVFARLHGRSARSSLAAFGALSFFLPCGFTQTVQVLALASGGFWQGAMLMTLFALGSLPMLMMIGVGASRAKRDTKHLARAMGALIVVMAVFQLQNGWRLSGLPSFWSMQTLEAAHGTFERGTYVVRIKVEGTEYSPAETKVPLGREVKLIVDGSEARGCMRSFAVPAYNIRQELTGESTEVSFTPTRLGPVNFTCAMGMGKGRVIVVPEQELGSL